jgi:hypothetical protein
MKLLKKENGIFVMRVSEGEFDAMRYSLRDFRYRDPEIEAANRSLEIEKRLGLTPGTLRTLYRKKIEPYLNLKEDQIIEFTLDDFKAIRHYVGKDFEILNSMLEYQTVVGTDEAVVESMLGCIDGILKEAEGGR